MASLPRIEREVRKVPLPEGAGHVSVCATADGRIVVRRFVARGGVINVIDKYDWVTAAGDSELRPLDLDTAHRIIDRAARGEPYSSCYVFYERPVAPEIDTTRSDMEHRFTSTGIKFWRHRRQMQSYREGTGHTVVSTHISPEGACNLRCPYCSVSQRDTHARIPLDTIHDYVEKLQSRGLKAVILTGGGEPTAYPHFNELVRWLKYERRLSVALITNGTLAHKLAPEVWKAFSWVRVSVNFFEGWEDRIRLPLEQLADDCVVGCSTVLTVEHEATRDLPADRVALLRRVAALADRLRARYVRVLPNCLLEDGDLLVQHRAIDRALANLGDSRFFHQHKLHAAPRAAVCHQAYFRPYLSEEVWGETGEPGTVYPCDSVVLNAGLQHFARRYGICRPGDILKFLDGQADMSFKPRSDCSGCVFTESVNQLEDWKANGAARFADFPIPLVHEEFV